MQRIVEHAVCRGSKISHRKQLNMNENILKRLLPKENEWNEELVNGYKHVTRELTARPTDVDKNKNVDIWTQFNSSQRFLRDKMK